MKNYINKLGFLFLFLDNLYLPIDLGFDFRINYLLQFLFITYFFITNSKLKVDKNFLILFLFTSTILFSISIIKGMNFLGFIKQFTLITYQLLYCYILLNSYKFNFEKILKDYLSIVTLICWVAIAQFITVKLGFLQVADLSYLGFNLGNFSSANGERIQSWFEEPSFLAYSLIPSIFIILSRCFKLHELVSIKKSILILTVLFLSTSSIGLLGGLISLAIIIFTKYPIIRKPIYLTIIIIIIPIVGYAIYHLPQVKFRVDDTYELFSAKNVSKEEINKTNLSTYALYSNYRITKEAFFENPLLGTGIGTYENNYNKYINKVIPKTPLRDMYHINNKDANSMFMRVLVETGVFGLMIFLILIFSNRVNFPLKNMNQSAFWAFNNGIFVLIILRLLRQGHYTSLGFIMFLLLYYYLKKEVTINERNN